MMKAPRVPKIPVSAVWWVDAKGDRHDPDIRPVPICTFGVVLKDTQEKITVAAEWGAEGTDAAPDHSEIITIPRGMIREAKVIARVALPEWVREWMLEEAKRA